MLRSRSIYQDLGEKPTTYVFGLENRQYTNKVMSIIFDADGVEHINTKDILNWQKKKKKKTTKKQKKKNKQFYENLYDKVRVSKIDHYMTS